MTLAEIHALDAGAWFGEQFMGERFLTFREALDLLAGTGIRLNIHVKAYEDDRQELVSLVVSGIERRNLLQQAFIASDQASIELAKAIQPELQVCNLSTEPLETYIARSAGIDCRILQPGNSQVDSSFVAEAHKQGMEVNPFYADDVEEMLRLINCGVDGILTNYPDRLQSLCWQLDRA